MTEERRGAWKEGAKQKGRGSLRGLFKSGLRPAYWPTDDTMTASPFSIDTQRPAWNEAWRFR